MTFHLCVYTIQSLFSLLYPLPPPSLFASPLLFSFFTIILPPSLYPSFLSSPLLPTFLLSPLSLLLPFPFRLVLT